MYSLIFLAIKTALCALLCQFCDCCDASDDCPDGVCDDLRSAIDDLQVGSPEVSAKRDRVAAFSINWQAVQDAIPLIAEAVRAIARIFKSPNVGS